MTARILIIDGYTQAGRDQFRENGASTAGELYTHMLKRWSPQAIDTEILYPADPGVVLPGASDLKGYAGIAWTGCSLSLCDDIEPVRKQIQLGKACFESQVPSFGSCWATQIACVSAGGKVLPNPQGREQGLARKITLTEAGLAHPMFEGKPAVFDAFTSHDDEVVDLSPYGVNLARNTWSEIQAADVQYLGGTFWSVQYHPEFDLHEMSRLVACRIPKLIRRGFFPDESTAQAYIEDLEQLHQEPSRRDIAWRLGIDSDVEDEAIRCVEVKNWLEKQVFGS